MNTIEFLRQEKIVAMLRGISTTHVDNTVRALYEGGIRILEVTTNTDQVYELVPRLRKEYDQLHIGVGTVLNVEMAKQAVDAGAQFLVSPNLDEEVIQFGLAQDIDVLPGVMTPTEIVKAVKAGAKAVKVFPVSSLGTSYIKEIRAPLDQIPMVATGGVNLDNIKDILEAGAFAVGIGGNLVDKGLLAAGDYAGLTRLSQLFIRAVEDVK